MKKLLIRAVLLALPFALLVGWFERKYVRAQNNQYIVKRALLEAAAPKIEVLVVGSSHGYQDILPAVLGPGAFNLGATSQSIYYDVGLILRDLDGLPSLKTVIMPLSDFTLEFQLDHGPERWRSYYYYRFHSLPHRDRHMTFHVRNFSLYFLYGRNYPFVRTDLTERDASYDFDRQGGARRQGRASRYRTAAARIR